MLLTRLEKLKPHKDRTDMARTDIDIRYLDESATKSIRIIREDLLNIVDRVVQDEFSRGKCIEYTNFIFDCLSEYVKEGD